MLAMRSWVVHIKVLMPSARAVSIVFSIVRSSLNLMDCALDFSSEIWLTPKNWLSPNNILSMFIFLCVGKIGRAGLLLLQVPDLEHDAVGQPGALECVDAVLFSAHHTVDEIIHLGRVFFAAQVKINRCGQFGNVPDVPSFCISVRTVGILEI